MRTLGVAIQFLTRLPVAIQDATAREVGRSAAWFPVVGILVGALVLGLYLALMLLFPLPIARILAILALVLIAGAFHLDGLADTADAFYAGRDRDSILRIMKDPHVGAMGTVAIVSILLMKAAAAVVLDEAFFRAGIFLAPLAGRTALVLGLSLPYARSEGLGRAFADHRSRADLPLALFLLVAIAFLVLRMPGTIASVAALGAASIPLAMSWRRLQGVTGDVCGAAGEVAETGFLLALAALMHLGALMHLDALTHLDAAVGFGLSG